MPLAVTDETVPILYRLKYGRIHGPHKTTLLNLRILGELKPEVGIAHVLTQTLVGDGKKLKKQMSNSEVERLKKLRVALVVLICACLVLIGMIIGLVNTNSLTVRVALGILIFCIVAATVILLIKKRGAVRNLVRALRAKFKTRNKISIAESNPIKIAEDNSSYFAPNYVLATKVTAPRSRQAFGRNAAEVDLSEPSDQKLAKFLTPGLVGSERIVIELGQGRVAKILDGIAHVTTLSPHQLNSDMLEGAMYLVLDLDAMNTGPWYGALRTTGTANNSRLHKFINQANKTGTLIIGLGATIPDHFTTSLEDVCHVVIRNEDSSLPWGNDIHMPVINHLVSASRGVNNHA